MRGHMRLLNTSFRTPSKNLALEEVLLDGLDGHGAPNVLRLWESAVPFVVVGVAQTIREHVHVGACREDGIPILRRCSAGGCVLQGPGCLNYSLFLRQEDYPEIRTIRGSYSFILDRIGETLRGRGVSARHKGTSDLAVSGKKVSGSAQKRRRTCILHHGTLLYEFDSGQMERYLREPADRPQYRGSRTHRGFVRCIPLPVAELRAAVREAFDAVGSGGILLREEREAVQILVDEKYDLADWNFRR